MNILFALPFDYATNSGLHVAGLARVLIQKGHACVVAIPKKPKENRDAVEPDLRVVSFTEAIALVEKEALFPNAGFVDVFHGWTPRGKIDAFHEKMKNAIVGISVLHLEDNEEELVRTFLGERVLRQSLAGQLLDTFPDSLTHPVKGQAFMKRVHGVSVLIDALKDKVPSGVSVQLVWPAADDRIFYPRAEPDKLRQQHGVPLDAFVIVYPGNVHPANFREVRSLYLAVHLLQRGGVNALIVRTGKDYYDVDHQYQRWADAYAINFGFLSKRETIGALLGMADVLVQPGRSDAFNDYRFPSKVPEYFACGKPVILPKTNIGLVTRHLKDAYVLDSADGVGIAEAVLHLIKDEALRSSLARGARLFYKKHFSWQMSAGALLTFYERLLGNQHEGIR